jgi:EpsD family peptidyl-prolyl cis-trans isomerase
MGSFMRRSYSLRRLPFALTAAGVVAALALAGCGEKKEEKKATQTAARVNKEEITVHQINFVLQQQRGLRQDQAEAAGKQALERLIDQELALQKASELKLDRDPRVLTQLEAAKRDIIARAYFDKVGDGAARPSNDDVKAYYDANPALFSQRRVYQLQELAIQAKPEQMDELQKKLKDAKTLQDFVKYLQASNIPFNGTQAVRPAEQIPLAVLPTIAKMKDGDSVFNKSDKGAQVIFLAASRAQPVDEVKAKPAIEQFLLNDRKRKLVQDDLKALRAGGKVEYMGKYAEGAPVAQPIAPAPTPAEVAASAAKALDEAAIKSGFGLKDNPSASARPAAPIAEPVTPSASSVDAGALKKGLGLK